MAKGTTMTKNVTSFGGSFPLHIYTITENINKRKITSSDTPAPSALKIDKIPKLNLSGFYPSHSINIKTHPINRITAILFIISLTSPERSKCILLSLLSLNITFPKYANNAHMPEIIPI